MFRESFLRIFWTPKEGCYSKGKEENILLIFIWAPNELANEHFLSLVELEFEECHQFPNKLSTIQCTFVKVS